MLTETELLMQQYRDSIRRREHQQQLSHHWHESLMARETHNLHRDSHTEPQTPTTHTPLPHKTVITDQLALTHRKTSKNKMCGWQDGKELKTDPTSHNTGKIIVTRN